MKPLSIGTVAKRAGCSVPTVRYYEGIGLMPAAARTEAGQRSYGDTDLQRLSFIRRCRDFGFTVEQVRELVGLVDQPERPCVEARDIAAQRLAEVRRKLKEMTALAADLGAFVRSCDAGCAGGTALDCAILQDLSAPIAAARCCS
jgi:DNA-binding transcriptional MerR regulator